MCGCLLYFLLESRQLTGEITRNLPRNLPRNLTIKLTEKAGFGGGKARVETGPKIPEQGLILSVSRNPLPCLRLRRFGHSRMHLFKAKKRIGTHSPLTLSRSYSSLIISGHTMGQTLGHASGSAGPVNKFSLGGLCPDSENNF